MTTKKQEEALEREEAERLGITVEELRTRFWQLLGREPTDDDPYLQDLEIVLQIHAPSKLLFDVADDVIKALSRIPGLKVEAFDPDDERIGFFVSVDDDELEQGEVVRR
jgi:hypothetical protein